MENVRKIGLAVLVSVSFFLTVLLVSVQMRKNKKDRIGRLEILERAREAKLAKSISKKFEQEKNEESKSIAV
jgi:hypothetical protein